MHKIEGPVADPCAAPVEPGKAGQPHQFGLTAAMALIVGSKRIFLKEFNLPPGELRFARQPSAARKAGRCGGHPTPRLVGNTIAS